MNPSIIKKLATIFLLAAFLVSSFSWGISFFADKRSQAEAGAQASALGSETFQPPDNAWRAARGGGTNGQNLTDGTISMFAKELVAINPQGPQAGSDGLLDLILPPGTDVESYLEQNRPALETFSPPVDESRIRIASGSDREDVIKYLEAITKIHEDLAADPAWRRVLALSSSGTDEGVDSMRRGAGILRATNDSIYAASVPDESLLDFHRALLAMSGTLAASMDLAAGDPVSSVIITTDLKSVLIEKSAELNRAAAEAKEKIPEILAGLPAEKNEVRALSISDIFSVPTAHAQFGVPITNPLLEAAATETSAGVWQTISQWLQDNWQGIVMGQLKTQLINRLAQEVIEWAQGSDLPGFVQNWLVFETRAASQAARDAIRIQAASLCGNAASGGAYGSILASVLGGEMDIVEGVYNTIGDPPECPGRPDRIYAGETNAFRWGGFLNDLVHNPFNDLVTLKADAARFAAAAGKAAINEARAGRGALNVNKCDDGSEPGAEGCEEGFSRAVTLASFRQDLTSRAGAAAIDLITGATDKSYEALVNFGIGLILDAALGESGLFSSDFGGGGGGGSTAPAADLNRRLGQYKDILETALAHNERAISAMDGAVDLLRSAIPTVCSNERIIAEALLLSEGLLEASDSFRAQTPEIEALLSVIAQFQADIASNPDGHGHTLEELERRVGSFTSVTGIANQALIDKDEAEETLNQANGLLQSCNSI